jgi:hypothetical protein
VTSPPDGRGVAIGRRAFLGAVAGAAATSLDDRRRIEGRIVGASARVGHLLRDGAPRLPVDAAVERCDVVVVGGGVSGLAAAWRLRAASLSVLVVELEPTVGGTSASGDTGVTRYPWGAHYTAAPNVEARAPLKLLSDIGAVTGWDAAGRPVFDPKLLCHAPAERLFYEGAWHEGLTPDGLSAAEIEEIERFDDVTNELVELVGADGRPAFTIPLDLSSRDPEILALDDITMADWLDQRGFTSAFVRWSVRYACLDDFGGVPEDVSAWAGLHYFAARKLRSAELEGSHFLVWPEGNGRLVRALAELGAPRVLTRSLARSVQATRDGVEVEVVDAAALVVRRVAARAAVVAAPAFVTRRIVAACPELPTRSASPWVVANLHVDWPFDPDRPWDSVLYGAEGLGYVDARHQMTDLRDGTVLTYYRAYGEPDVRAARAALVDRPWESLVADALADLAPAHPGLAEEVSRVDVMIWGHGMPRPRPGFLGPRPFEPVVQLGPRVAWAHVDQGGMALFEEALTRGVRAAEALGPCLGRPLGETWT